MSHELYRGSEAFPRVYSPPEPPSGPHRSAMLRIAVAVVAFGLAAGAFLLFTTQGGGKPTAGNQTKGRPTSSANTRTSPPVSATSRTTAPATRPAPAGGQPFSRVPAPCGTPDQGTIDRLVSGQQTVQRISRPDDSMCVVTSGDYTTSLVVETKLEAPGRIPDPVGAAQHDFAADFTQAQQGNGYDQTLSVGRDLGLGEEAFRWAKLDKGGPTPVVGEVETRLHNAIIIVTYSQNARSGESQDAASRRLLDAAAGVARQALGAYS